MTNINANFIHSADFVHRDQSNVEINASSYQEAREHCSQILVEEFKTSHREVIAGSSYPEIEAEWTGFLEQKAVLSENRFDVIVAGSPHILEITAA